MFILCGYRGYRQIQSDVNNVSLVMLQSLSSGRHTATGVLQLRVTAHLYRASHPVMRRNPKSFIPRGFMRARRVGFCFMLYFMTEFKWIPLWRGIVTSLGSYILTSS
jgi:hypothetical protein